LLGVAVRRHGHLNRRVFGDGHVLGLAVYGARRAKNKMSFWLLLQGLQDIDQSIDVVFVIQ
jgi:hypothetical protein